MVLEALHDRSGSIDDDGLVEAPEYVVHEEGQPAVVIQVGMADDHMANAELLFQREQPRQPAGVECYAIVQKKAREESSPNASPGTAQDAELHRLGADSRRTIGKWSARDK